MYMDIKKFTEIIKNSIDKEGLFPHIGYGITKDDKVDMFALMTELSALPQVRKFIIMPLLRQTHSYK